MSTVYQNQTDLAYWAALATLVEPTQLRKIAQFAPTGEEAFAIREETLARLGFRPSTVTRIIAKRKTVDPQAVLEQLASQGITILPITDRHYPPTLKQISDAPHLLYIKGDLQPAFDKPTLAIVGTRAPSPYGREATLTLTRQLARAGLVIVSGLALGIDAITHEACIEAGGLTLAVLGSGLDDKNIYPQSNRKLAQLILKTGGALISEYAPGTQGLPHHFLERNRLIAGLTRGTLVIEGSHNSGSLVTAQCALEYNREVLAVPGRVGDPLAQGPLRLIANGAHMVTSVDDVFSALNLAVSKIEKQPPTVPKLNVAESELFALISKESLNIDILVERVNKPAHEILTTLTTLELKGVIRDTGGQRYTSNI